MMKYILVGFLFLGGVGSAIGGWYWYQTRPEAFPYADQVPADALLYLAIPDLLQTLDEINQHPEWKETFSLGKTLSRLEEHRTYLAGPAALFATVEKDRLTWTTLLKLKNGQTHREGPPQKSGETIEAHIASFRTTTPRTRMWVNLSPLPTIVREVWGSYSQALLEFDFSKNTLHIDGLLSYRKGAYRDILENRVNAPFVIDPGNASLAVSGLSNIDELWKLLKLNPSIPKYERSLLGPAWGVQFRSPEDLAFWFDLSGTPLLLDGASWRDFQTTVEGDRWIGFTKDPPIAEPRSSYHEIIRLKMPQAAQVFRTRYGDRGEPLFRWMERFKQVESRLTYGGDAASLSVILTRP